MTLRSLPTATRSLVLDMTVPGNPIPWRRVRRGAQGQSYVPADVVNAENVFGLMALSAGVRTCEEGPLTITATFYRDNRRAVDIDNLFKLVMDAGNGVVWKDDSQVVEAHLSKRLDRENPRTEVTVWRLV